MEIILSFTIDDIIETIFVLIKRKSKKLKYNKIPFEILNIEKENLQANKI